MTERNSTFYTRCKAVGTTPEWVHEEALTQTFAKNEDKHKTYRNLKSYFENKEAIDEMKAIQLDKNAVITTVVGACNIFNLQDIHELDRLLKSLVDFGVRSLYNSQELTHLLTAYGIHDLKDLRNLLLFLAERNMGCKEELMEAMSNKLIKQDKIEHTKILADIGLSKFEILQRVVDSYKS